MKKYIHYITFISALFALLLTSCDESSQIDTNDVKSTLTEPVITTFQPTSGAPGTKIMLTGTSLSNVDSVYIGGQAVKVKNRISDTKLLVEVTANAVTGKIKAKSPKGTGESSTDFTIAYLIPTITDVTSIEEGKLMIGETAEITGTDLKAVTKILVNNIQAEIISISDTKASFKVPRTTVGSSVKVTIQYMNGANTESADSPDSYTILGPLGSPSILDCPQTALINTTVTITGDNLDQANAVIVGGKTLSFASQTKEEIKFLIPTTYATQVTSDMILVYNDTEQMVIKENFVVTVPDISPNIIFYPQVTIGAQSPEMTSQFFNAATGATFSACEYATRKNEIDFYINWSEANSAIRINNPNNSGNITKLFSCGGVFLDGEKMPNIVKFRVLTSTSDINKYANPAINRTLESISTATIGTVATSSTPQSGSNFKEGNVIMFQIYSNSTTAAKTGFIEITNINIPNDESEKTKSSITFNCFFEK